MKLGAIPITKNTATDENVSASDSLNTTSHELINNTKNENASVDLEQNIIEEIICTESIEKEHLDEQQCISGNFSDCSQQQIYSSAIIDEKIKDANSIENVEVQEQMSTDGNRYNDIPPEDNSETFSLATIIKILENQGVPQN